MSSSVLNRKTLIAYAKGATWGTAPTFGAGDGLLTSKVEMNRKIQVAPVKTAGAGWEGFADLGNDEPVDLSFQMTVYEEDKNAMLLAAQMFGTDVATGAGDPYTHTMTAGDEANKFGGLAREEGSQVKVAPSFKPTSLGLSFDGNGNLQMDVSGTAPMISIASYTTLGSVTYEATRNPFKLKNSTFRLNTIADALDAGDAVTVTDWKFTPVRAIDKVHGSGSSSIMEPKEGDFPEWKLEFTIPRKSSVSETLIAAHAAGTTAKADMTITGSSANRSLTLSLPLLKIEDIQGTGDVISTKVVCRVQKAAANPTGMSSTYPVLVWKNDIAATTL